MQRIIKYNKHYVKEVIFLPISSLYEIEQLTFCPDNLILIGILDILKKVFMIIFFIICTFCAIIQSVELGSKAAPLTLTIKGLNLCDLFKFGINICTGRFFCLIVNCSILQVCLFLS